MKLTKSDIEYVTLYCYFAANFPFHKKSGEYGVKFFLGTTELNCSVPYNLIPNVGDLIHTINPSMNLNPITTDLNRSILYSN